MDNIEAIDVWDSINKPIKWKSFGRKSYIKKKILDNDIKDDYIQLCYEYHKLLLKNEILEKVILLTKVS